MSVRPDRKALSVLRLTCEHSASLSCVIFNSRLRPSIAFAKSGPLLCSLSLIFAIFRRSVQYIAQTVTAANSDLLCNAAARAVFAFVACHFHGNDIGLCGTPFPLCANRQSAGSLVCWWFAGIIVMLLEETSAGYRIPRYSPSLDSRVAASPTFSQVVDGLFLRSHES
jgi:hypothetical protein